MDRRVSGVFYFHLYLTCKIMNELAQLNYLPTAYAAPPETRDLRLYVRHREILVHERSQSKNRIHAVLAGYNLRLSATDLFGKAGREGWKARTVQKPHPK